MKTMLRSMFLSRYSWMNSSILAMTRTYQTSPSIRSASALSIAASELKTDSLSSKMKDPNAELW
jgi:hypothetical protein